MKTATPTSPWRREARRVIAGVIEDNVFGPVRCQEVRLALGFEVRFPRRHHRRKLRVVTPRQVCMAILRSETNLTLQDIGAIFGMDYGTVIHAVEAVSIRAGTDAAFRQLRESIMRQVRRPIPA